MHVGATDRRETDRLGEVELLVVRRDDRIGQDRRSTLSASPCMASLVKIVHSR
ncbi:MAG: hypothetical protein L0I76_01535 [Pseudonocardia sp.]|nr:hypothetical protein [Pseudonocardia sp.]